MSNHRFCCCGTSVCTSNFRVFMPCSETFSNVEVLPPALTVSQFNASGMTEGTVYLYDALESDCDEYCGQWVCTGAADATGAICYTDLADCPDCSEWGGTTVDPPFRGVRPSEEASFYARFTSMDDCCDDRCPQVDCGQGEVIPSDCGVCYDASDLSWSLGVAFSNMTQSTSGIPATMRVIGVNLTNVVATISGTSLIIDFDLEVDFETTPTPTNWDCVGPAPAVIGCIACGDPGTDTFPDNFTTSRSHRITVPCMSAPILSATGSQTVDPPTYCGGLGYPGPGGMGIGSTPTVSQPIGWGGNTVCFSSTTTNSFTLNNHPHLSASPIVAGSVDIEIELELALPPRPEDCP